MIRMLNRYRDELGVTALPQEMALAAQRTEEHLRSSTVDLALETPARAQGRVEVAVTLTNTAGHKFPTAYPSRRAWLHLTVQDAQGRAVFESGAFMPDGRIVGNDNDQDPTRYEPHYTRITSSDEVQVYEAVMADRGGAVTTGLMTAETWVKDNRLLPRGFSAAEGGSRVATRGSATADGDFAPGSDRVLYSVAVDEAAGPFSVTAELVFQPIGYRWAENLSDYDAFETQRFVRYYRSMSETSALVIAEARATVR